MTFFVSFLQYLLFSRKKQKRRKIIESLLEKHKQERLLREAKAEQKLTDDIVSSKQARLLMDKDKVNS